MMDKQISITAAMRGDGFQKLDQQLAKIEERAKRITQEMGKWGSGIGGKGSYFEHPAASPSSSGAPRGGRRAPSGGSSSAQSYDLNSPTGLINWDENVLSVALPTLESINKASNGSGSGITTGTTVPRRRSRSGALSSSMPTSYGDSHLQRFMQAAKGHSSVGGILANGLKGVIGGALGDAVAGGAAAGAGGMALGGLLGLAGGPVGMLAGAGVAFIGSQLSQGYSQWQQTAPGISQLVHSLGQASQGVEQFRVNVLMAGANMAMSLTQSAQAASMLTQSFGNVSEAGITKLVTQTGAAALYNGIAPSQMAQIIGSSATAGITSGVGRSMSVGQYTGMLANMTLASHMQGRQASLYQGLTNIYGTLAATNPIISNPNGVAAQYAAMNASGIQGLQGLRGAQLVSQMDQGFASAQGIQQALAFSAIMKASGGKITDPFQMMSLMEQGTAAKIGNTTLGGAYASTVRGITGNKYLQGSLFGMGLNINQAMAVLQHGGLNATGISTSNAQMTPLSLSDKLRVGKSIIQVQQSRAGHSLAALNALPGNVLMGIPDALGPNGTKYFYNGNGQYTTAHSPNNLVHQVWSNNASNVSPPGSYFNMATGKMVTPPQAMLNYLLPAIAQQESHGNLYTINDNSAGGPNGKAYYFKNRSQYIAKANALIAKGHQLALGPFQLESFHKGVTPQTAANWQDAAKMASNILMTDYNATGSWSKALQDYSGNTPNYAASVESIAQKTLTTNNAMNLSPTTIQAIGNAVAQAMIKFTRGPVR